SSGRSPESDTEPQPEGVVAFGAQKGMATCLRSSPNAQKFPQLRFQPRSADSAVSAARIFSAVEIEEYSARFFDNHFQRSKIPQRGVRLNPYLGLAARDQHRVGRSAKTSNGPEAIHPIEEPRTKFNSIQKIEPVQA